VEGLLPVSDEQVVAYQELVAYLAARYDGFQGAEYDDLYQEGMEVVYLALARATHPSKDILARRMLDWVGKCARKGMTYGEPE
jgi:hypothetical protein